MKLGVFRALPICLQLCAELFALHGAAGDAMAARVWCAAGSGTARFRAAVKPFSANALSTRAWRRRLLLGGVGCRFVAGRRLAWSVLSPGAGVNRRRRSAASLLTQPCVFAAESTVAQALGTYCLLYTSDAADE